MKNKILMINAVNEVVRKNGESMLLADHIEKISKVYQVKEDIDGFSKIVTIEEIASNAYSLNISLYAYTNVIESNDDLNSEDALQSWKSCSDTLRLSFGTFINLLNE